MTTFLEVTELAGDEVSQEQVARVATRYAWAQTYAKDKDVLEIACGTGPGLGLLKSASRSFVAGDISEQILARARAHYGSRVDMRVMDAMALPFGDQSLDVILIFEALYYVPNAQKFADECRRVLRPGGVVLVSNANKDLFDFNPSPHSHVYHGVVELSQLFGSRGFSTRFWGDIPVSQVSWRQKLLRPVKRLVIKFNLMPKSMAGKKLLKRLVFGEMRPFPAELTQDMLAPQSSLHPIEATRPDTVHKVILCEARRAN